MMSTNRMGLNQVSKV